MKPTAWSYDNNGFLNGVVKCQPCQKTLGVYYLPAKATWVEPPKPVEGKQVKWMGDKWAYIDIVKPYVQPTSAEVENPVEVRDNPVLLQKYVDNLRHTLARDFAVVLAEKLSETDVEFQELWEDVNRTQANTAYVRDTIETLVTRLAHAETEIQIQAQRIANTINSYDSLLKYCERLESDFLSFKAKLNLAEPEKSPVIEATLEVVEAPKQSWLKRVLS